MDEGDVMRLTDYEQSAIRDETASCFGSSAKVFLFGSRVNDKSRGGDIDILIKLGQSLMDAFSRKVRFLVNLKSKIGDQHIDVVVANPNDDRDVVRIAEEQGVQL